MGKGTGGRGVGGGVIQGEGFTCTFNPSRFWFCWSWKLNGGRGRGGDGGEREQPGSVSTRRLILSEIKCRGKRLTKR